MDKKIFDFLKEEEKIPKEIMDKIVQNRQLILNGNIKPTNKIKWITIVTTTVTVVAVISIILFNPQVNMAIKNIFGISQDNGIEMVENNNISTDINLKSIKNDMEITLTKFISTNKKYAFDYQFEIKNEELKKLLEKDILAGNDSQFIDFQLFDKNNSEYLNGGETISSTFRMEGNMFYGSVISTFTKNKITDNANLILIINKLEWQDRDEFERLKEEALANPEIDSFSLDPALVYSGDWTFEIDTKPLTKTSTPIVTDSNNISDIKVKSDALQTTATFIAKEAIVDGYSSESQDILSDRYSVSLYKDEVKFDNQLFIESWNPSTGQFEIVLNFSYLDKLSVYKIQVNQIDEEGKSIREVGSFDLYN